MTRAGMTGGVLVVEVRTLNATVASVILGSGDRQGILCSLRVSLVYRCEGGIYLYLMRPKS